MRSGVNLQDEFLSGHYHYPCFAQGANTWNNKNRTTYSRFVQFNSSCEELDKYVLTP